MRARTVRSTLVALTSVVLATSWSATAPAHASSRAASVAPRAVAALAPTEAPPTPVLYGAVPAVDGVRLYWFGTRAGEPNAQTSYIVRRTGDGPVREWTQPSYDQYSQLTDREVRPGVAVSYEVIAVNGLGQSAATSPLEATRPTWDGPYSPDRSALSIVWDRAESSATPNNHDTVQAGDGSSEPLSVARDPNGWAFTGGRGSMSVPDSFADGDYEVGPDPGQLSLAAIGGGGFCNSLTVPVTGHATVRRAARNLDGWASLSLDADLLCADGYRAKVELRWHTPEPFHRVESAASVLEAAPGTSVTHDVAVTNTGDLPVTLGAARLIDAEFSTSSPLAVVGSTCVDTVLAPGASCAVSVQYTAGALGDPEGNGLLAIESSQGELELDHVIGQHSTPDARPVVDAAATGTPQSIVVSWRTPQTMDCRLTRNWRVVDAGQGAPLWTAVYGCPTAASLRGLAPGPHQLRVLADTIDGRTLTSDPVTMTVARRWLLLGSPNGVIGVDPDGGNAAGGLIGSRVWIKGVDVSPSRTKQVVATGQVEGSLAARSMAGGALAPGLTNDNEIGDDQPAVSPDGLRVAFRRPAYPGNTGKVTGLGIMPLSGGTVTMVPGSLDLSTPEWTADGAALYATLNSGAGIVRVDPATGTRTLVPNTAGATELSVSRTGRIAWAAFNTGGPLHLLDPGKPEVVFDLATDPTSLDWDPSGRWLAVSQRYAWETSNPGRTDVIDTAGTTPRLVRTLPLGGFEVAWYDPATSSPSATVSVPAWTTASPIISVAATDADDAPGGLVRSCRVDGAAWAPCGATVRLAGLAAGNHSISARVVDPAGNTSVEASRTWSVDAAAPAASLAALPTANLSGAVSLSWSATDLGGSGVLSYDLRQRTATLGSGLGAYVMPSSMQGLRTRAATVSVAKGARPCFSVRARDAAGNVGPWSAERCTTVALDDRALSASAGWTRGASTAYAYGTYSRTTVSGSALTSASSYGRRVFVVATRCATCGAVDVFQGGLRLGRVNLYASTTGARQVFWLPAAASPRRGAVVLRTVGSKVVYADGVGVQL